MLFRCGVYTRNPELIVSEMHESNRKLIPELPPTSTARKPRPIRVEGQIDGRVRLRTKFLFIQSKYPQLSD